MNDDGSGEDLPIIDVRSPAERFADSGRDGLARLRERLDDGPLDVAALIWMICVIGTLAVQIYGAFDNQFDGSFDSEGWFTAAVLASSGNYVLAFGCMLGIGLAAWGDSGPARVALALAILGGAWAIVASLIGVAVIYHESLAGSLLFLTSLGDNRAVSSVGTLLQGGLGIVVVLVASSLLASRRASPASDSEIAPLD
jgi:hypothetical protein